MNRDILELFVLLNVEFNCLSMSTSIDENTESLNNIYQFSNRQLNKSCANTYDPKKGIPIFLNVKTS